MPEPERYKYLIDLVLKMENICCYYWGLFHGVNVLVIGFMISLKQYLNLFAKVIGTSLYLIYVVGWLIPHLEQYDRTDNAISALAAQKCRIAKNIPELSDFSNLLIDWTYMNHVYLIFIVYMVSVILILSLIWLDKLWKKLPEKL